MKEMKDHELWRRGNREGSELFKKWFNNLNEAALAGEHGAYVFVMGSLAEILHSF